MDKPLHTLSLIEAAQGIRERRFTSEAYTEALLRQIALLDGEIQAWTWLQPEEAIRAAALTDHRLQSGEAPGPLQGLPIGVKDIYATAGIPTEMGSPAFAGHVPNASARVIERLAARGAFVMGKTVTTECAFYSPGKTRNPWNSLHTPGGSSSGSAAAVAAGFIPGALGTQTNGSIIRPAAFCGIVGFKPTQGLIPIAGALTFSQTLDQAGVLTRSVEDAAWFAAALTEEGTPLSAGVCIRSAAPRLAAVRTPFWDQAEEHAKQNFGENIRVLREGGARVDEVDLPGIFDGAHRAIRTIMSVEAALNLEELFLKQAHLLSPTLRDFIAEGRETGAVVYLRALALRRALIEELERFLEGFDAIITPPTTGEAPQTLEQTGNPGFCSIWSLCGVPAVTIPVGFGPRRLPLGLQIVAPANKDDRALSVARWCEKWFPFPFWRKMS
ncbi:MAG: amidase [Deltaproteobacteria bacterium]|nr:amidase [Deltaproteobacteria bacterium]